MNFFAKSWNFKFVYSSPRYPRSNGLAEKAVHIAKCMIKKATESHGDVSYSLLEYRTSPVANTGLSPSQMLMSRLLRTKIPTHDNILQPRLGDPVERLKQNQLNHKINYDKLARRKEIELNPGDNVVYKSNGKWEPAVVVTNSDHPRSYGILNENNNIIRRNSIHLRKSMNGPNIRRHGIEDYSNNSNYSNSEKLVVQQDSTNAPVAAAGGYVTKSGRIVKTPDFYKA